MIALHAVAPLRPMPRIDFWATADGRDIPVTDLTDTHIANIINRFAPALNRGSLTATRRLMVEAVFLERDRRRGR